MSYRSVCFAAGSGFWCDETDDDIRHIAAALMPTGP
jgi:hypothetical protein